jgi:hypothetical protein
VTRLTAAEVAAVWNVEHPPGTRVRVWPTPVPSARSVETTTRAAAAVYRGRASVPVAALPGMVPLTHVEAVPPGEGG